jgi:hypothetical protein
LLTGDNTELIDAFCECMGDAGMVDPDTKETLGHRLAAKGHEQSLRAWLRHMRASPAIAHIIHTVDDMGFSIGHTCASPECLKAWHDAGGDIHTLARSRLPPHEQSYMDINEPLSDGNRDRLNRAWICLGGSIAHGPKGAMGERRAMRAAMLPGSPGDHGLTVTHAYLDVIGIPPSHPSRAWEQAAFRSATGSALAQRLMQEITDPIVLASFIQRMSS